MHLILLQQSTLSWICSCGGRCMRIGGQTWQRWWCSTLLHLLLQLVLNVFFLLQARCMVTSGSLLRTKLWSTLSLLLITLTRMVFELAVIGSMPCFVGGLSVLVALQWSQFEGCQLSVFFEEIFWFLWSVSLKLTQLSAFSYLLPVYMSYLVRDCHIMCFNTFT